MINRNELVAFLIRAKQKTYAGHGAEVESSRPASHDLRYEEGPLLYIDTFLGGAKFAGEEAVWHDGVPLWSMNYYGRVIGEPFSGDFEWFQGYEDISYKGQKIYELHFHGGVIV